MHTRVNRAEEIRRLCEAWISEVHSKDGSIGIGGASEQYRLLRNGIQFHELDFESLRYATTFLTKTLLLRGYNTIIDFDHRYLWSWLAEINHELSNIPGDMQAHQFRMLFSTVARTSLSGVRNPNISREEWERWNQIESLMEHNSLEMTRQTTLILSYLVFPLLEAVCRKHNSAFVLQNGEVIQSFNVNRADGSIRTYKIGSKCSNLHHMLILLEQNCSPSTKFHLAEMKRHIEWLTQSREDAYETIFNWRNESLHGETSHATIGGTILGWCYQIALDGLEDNFDNHADQVFERVQREIQSYQYSQRRSPWSYYPPI